jgi:hypothetical protein
VYIVITIKSNDEHFHDNDSEYYDSDSDDDGYDDSEK